MVVTLNGASRAEKKSQQQSNTEQQRKEKEQNRRNMMRAKQLQQQQIAAKRKQEQRRQEQRKQQQEKLQKQLRQRKERVQKQKQEPNQVPVRAQPRAKVTRNKIVSLSKVVRTSPPKRKHVATKAMKEITTPAPKLSKITLNVGMDVDATPSPSIPASPAVTPATKKLLFELGAVTNFEEMSPSIDLDDLDDLGEEDDELNAEVLAYLNQ